MGEEVERLDLQVQPHLPEAARMGVCYDVLLASLQQNNRLGLFLDEFVEVEHSQLLVHRVQRQCLLEDA